MIKCYHNNNNSQKDFIQKIRKCHLLISHKSLGSSKNFHQELNKSLASWQSTINFLKSKHIIHSSLFIEINTTDKCDFCSVPLKSILTMEAYFTMYLVDSYEQSYKMGDS